jgi:threonine dehydrogenase-like Zn-dependent dehydrogenase
VKAIVYEDVGRLAVHDVPDPTIEDPADAVVRVSSSAICGSDLHFYHGKAPLSPGDGIGHEGMGVVEAVGPDVKRFAVGDRVVISFVIACGGCWFCQREQTSLCQHYRMVGGGPFGGSLGGTQAEAVRVPVADVNLLRVPDGMADEQVLFLGDILTTAYYGTAIAGIRPEETVAVVGAGPVGFLAMQAARVHGAGRVLSLDMEPARLELAERFGAVPINVRERHPQSAVFDLTDGRGADVVVECVGNEVAYETATRSVRSGGTVAVVGVYVSEQAEIPLGVYWTRMLTVRFAGICPVQAWWEKALGAVQAGTIDPVPIISHTMPLDEGPKGYEMFDTRQATKVVLKP